MNTSTIPRQLNTFEVHGEKFIVLKKDYLDELLLLMKSVATGERMLKEKKTRSFGEFIKRARIRR